MEGGASNVIENIESSYSTCRGIWARTDKLVVSGGYYHQTGMTRRRMVALEYCRSTLGSSPLCHPYQ